MHCLQNSSQFWQEAKWCEWWCGVSDARDVLSGDGSGVSGDGSGNVVTVVM